MVQSIQLVMPLNQAVETVKPFVPAHQLKLIKTMFRGEEGDYFKLMVKRLASQIAIMPKTYETDGKGDDASVLLHYFMGSSDWYIIEKDSEPEQLQAYGFVDLGYGGEAGYVCIAELCDSNKVEIDLHWTPKTLGAIKRTD